MTSAQAAARLLADRLPPSAPVALLGAPALAAEVRLAGLEPVPVDAPEAQALVSGYGPDVLWREVMRAAVLVRDGLWWVASNTDASIPTCYGIAPGHGVLVDTVSRFAGVAPVVAGKPERPLLDETVRRIGGDHPLMVGDRLDTDIAGAVNAGLDSLLVLTGVTGLAELVRARPDERPDVRLARSRGTPDRPRRDDRVGRRDQQRWVGDDDDPWPGRGPGAGVGRCVVARRRSCGLGTPGPDRRGRRDRRAHGARRCLMAPPNRTGTLGGMTEEPVDEHGTEESSGDVVNDLEGTVAETEPVHTGLDRVDSVMDDVARLTGEPVGEHVAVFESAHERLRRTLDDPEPDPDQEP